MQFLQFQMAGFFDGIAIPFGYCKVYLTGTATLASLFDSGGSPMSNPAHADSSGQVGFAAADGLYDFQPYYADGVTVAGPKILKQQMFDLTNISSNSVVVATRTILSGLVGPTSGMSRYLAEAGREGWFVFSTANLSAQVSADTAQGIYVAPSGATSGASGAWVRKWSGPLDIRWFGAPVTGDCTAIGTGTDVAPAINAAAATGLSISKSCSIYIPGGTLGYRVASTLVFTSGVKLVGDGFHQNPGNVGGTVYSAPQTYRGSILVFDANVAGLKFIAFTDHLANATANQYESSVFSVVRDLMLYGGGGTSVTAHGIETRTVVVFENVRVDNFAGNGFHIFGYTAGAFNYGATNLSKFISCKAILNGCHGFYIQGSDVNAMSLDTCDASLNGGVGFLDKSIIQNSYFSCHSATNNQSFGASSAARTQVVSDWAGLSDQTAGSYVTVNGNAAQTIYLGCYTESGNGTKAEILWPSLIIGGILSSDASHTTSSTAQRFNGPALKNIGSISADSSGIVSIAKGYLDLDQDLTYIPGSTGRLQWNSVLGLVLTGNGSSFDFNLRNSGGVSAILLPHGSTIPWLPGGGLEISELAAASVPTPASGQTLFFDTADHKLKRKDSGGTVTTIA